MWDQRLRICYHVWRADLIWYAARVRNSIFHTRHKYCKLALLVPIFGKAKHAHYRRHMLHSPRQRACLLRSVQIARISTKFNAFT